MKGENGKRRKEKNVIDTSSILFTVYIFINYLFNKSQVKLNSWYNLNNV